MKTLKICLALLCLLRISAVGSPQFGEATLFMENVNEVWKEIPGYESRYHASTYGRIKSARMRNGVEKIIQQMKNAVGTTSVCLFAGRKFGRTFFQTHFLIAKTFIGTVEYSQSVVHIDGVTSNNCLSNLKIITRFDDAGETWKAIKDYCDYEVSSLARVRSRKSTDIVILKPNKTRSGYFLVWLSKNSIPKGKSIHRLVAEAFIPNPNNLPQVNHKNGVKTDNLPDNLEWVTPSENSLHSYRSLGRKGVAPEKTFTNKLTRDQVSQIRKLRSNGMKMIDISRQFNISLTNTYQIVNKQTWKENG